MKVWVATDSDDNAIGVGTTEEMARVNASGSIAHLVQSSVSEREAELLREAIALLDDFPAAKLIVTGKREGSRFNLLANLNLGPATSLMALSLNPRMRFNHVNATPTLQMWVNGNMVVWDRTRRQWLYEDGEPAMKKRPCPSCHRLPHIVGGVEIDGCFDRPLPGVIFACCGHGVEVEGQPLGYITFWTGDTVSVENGTQAMEVVAERAKANDAARLEVQREV